MILCYIFIYLCLVQQIEVEEISLPFLSLSLAHCHYSGWGGGEGQLVQLGVIHSPDILSHKLVLVGVGAELVQLAEGQLAQLQLGVGAELVQLAVGQLAQLQLGVGAQAHGGGHCHQLITLF